VCADWDSGLPTQVVRNHTVNIDEIGDGGAVWVQGADVNNLSTGEVVQLLTAATINLCNTYLPAWNALIDAAEGVGCAPRRPASTRTPLPTAC
jgi:hypothetical protein